MGVMRLNRRSSLILVTGLCVSAIAIAVLVDLDRSARPAEVQGVFEEPATFCGTIASQGFEERVQDVERAVAHDEAPGAASLLTASLIRRAASLPDTPASLRTPIQLLATDIERAGEGPFERASTRAATLDRAARRHCG